MRNKVGQLAVLKELHIHTSKYAGKYVNLFAVCTFASFAARTERKPVFHEKVSGYCAARGIAVECVRRGGAVTPI